MGVSRLVAWPCEGGKRPEQGPLPSALLLLPSRGPGFGKPRHPTSASRLLGKQVPQRANRPEHPACLRAPRGRERAGSQVSGGHRGQPQNLPGGQAGAALIPWTASQQALMELSVGQLDARPGGSEDHKELCQGRPKPKVQGPEVSRGEDRSHEAGLSFLTLGACKSRPGERTALSGLWDSCLYNHPCPGPIFSCGWQDGWPASPAQPPATALLSLFRTGVS